MKLTITPRRKNEYLNTYRYRQIDEASGVCASTALICIRGTRFSGSFIPTMTVADVSTLPEYRNRGLVREMLETAHSKAREYGAVIALLHPFSFDFYRKFGYERISDTVSATYPISTFELFSDGAPLMPLEEKYYDDLVELFRSFSENRNLMFDRYNIASFLKKKEDVFVFVYRETLCGYISIKKDMEQRSITVSEMAFSNEDALRALLSHLNTYKESFDTILFADLEPTPEIYSLLDGGRMEMRGDLAARLLDTEALLLANEYPVERGEFILRVKDTLPTVDGVFKVTYENKKATVERLSDDATADVTAEAPTFLRRIYGCDESTEGFVFRGDASDFLRAFPKRINGLFEHF
jgi:predicted acetyltransferase